MKFVDKKAVQKELDRITKEREQLKRRQAALRVQTHRLKKLLELAP